MSFTWTRYRTSSSAIHGSYVVIVDRDTWTTGKEWAWRIWCGDEMIESMCGEASSQWEAEWSAERLLASR